MFEASAGNCDIVSYFNVNTSAYNQILFKICKTALVIIYSNPPC